MADTVLTERHDGVLVITLNRPEVRNAIDLETAESIAGALDQLDGDDAMTVGVLTGAGKGFSAGMDLKAFAAGGARPWVADRGLFGIAGRSARKPLIAAVEGFALAGGFEIVLACDLIVAARGALFGIPEVRRGLVAAGGGVLRLPRRIPYNVAMELALTGEPIEAERAAALGLVNRVCEPGGALAAALELAESVRAGGPLALIASKQILDEQWDWQAQDRWERQAVIAEPVISSEDAREGARAFAEKRDAVWSGR
jgi:enoyl-CoA hydratase